ncbi:MAG: hypothetical protein FWB75_01505, partial [Oscillospiraceae bacterium]|nr:hypothetical protein [Oscillospiraceae bacterium]
QARVHYALTQTAKTLSVYCYTLEAAGVAADMTALDNKADKTAIGANELRKELNAVFKGGGSLKDIGSRINSAGNVINLAYGYGEEAVGNPEAVLQQMLSFGQNELRNQVFELVARPMVGRYLSNGDKTADEYLRSARVVNSRSGAVGLSALEFHQFGNLGTGNSVLLDKDGNVKLTVEYEVEYTFGALPLPFNPTLKITQTAITKAWLNGSGQGYW